MHAQPITAADEFICAASSYVEFVIFASAIMLVGVIAACVHLPNISLAIEPALLAAFLDVSAIFIPVTA